MAWNIENIEVDDDIILWKKWEHGRCVILTII